jgi:signal peptidase
VWCVLVALVATAWWFFGWVVVTGGSMRPTLTAGDTFVYRRGNAGLQPGDAVLVSSARGGFVHRVVSAMPDGSIVTRGDANPIPDLEPTRREEVSGRGVAVLRTGAVLRGFVVLAARARLLYQSHTWKR